MNHLRIYIASLKVDARRALLLGAPGCGGAAAGAPVANVLVEGDADAAGDLLDDLVADVAAILEAHQVVAGLGEEVLAHQRGYGEEHVAHEGHACGLQGAPALVVLSGRREPCPAVVRQRVARGVMAPILVRELIRQEASIEG